MSRDGTAIANREGDDLVHPSLTGSGRDVKRPSRGPASLLPGSIAGPVTDVLSTNDQIVVFVTDYYGQYHRPAIEGGVLASIRERWEDATSWPSHSRRRIPDIISGSEEVESATYCRTPNRSTTFGKVYRGDMVFIPASPGGAGRWLG